MAHVRITHTPHGVTCALLDDDGFAAFAGLTPMPTERDAVADAVWAAWGFQTPTDDILAEADRILRDEQIVRD